MYLKRNPEEITSEKQRAELTIATGRFASYIGLIAAAVDPDYKLAKSTYVNAEDYSSGAVYFEHDEKYAYLKENLAREGHMMLKGVVKTAGHRRGFTNGEVIRCKAECQVLAESVAEIGEMAFTDSPDLQSYWVHPEEDLLLVGNLWIAAYNNRHLVIPVQVLTCGAVSEEMLQSWTES